MTEVWAYHQAHAERHERYRPAIAEFVEAARNFTDAGAYLAAQCRRAQGTAAWEDWFAEHDVDLVLEPTLPIVPYERGPGYERGHPAGPGDPMIALTALWDMTGMPVAALPVTWQAGVSLVAPRGREAALLQAAIDLQEHALGVPQWSPTATTRVTAGGRRRGAELKPHPGQLLGHLPQPPRRLGITGGTSGRDQSRVAAHLLKSVGTDERTAGDVGSGGVERGQRAVIGVLGVDPVEHL